MTIPEIAILAVLFLILGFASLRLGGMAKRSAAMQSLVVLSMPAPSGFPVCGGRDGRRLPWARESLLRVEAALSAAGDYRLL